MLKFLRKSSTRSITNFLIKKACNTSLESWGGRGISYLLFSSFYKYYRAVFPGFKKCSFVSYLSLAQILWAFLSKIMRSYFTWIWLATSRKEIFTEINLRKFFFRPFAGINFGRLGFTEDFAGINFCELSLTKDFVGINFHESILFKDFPVVNLTFALRNIFSTNLVYGVPEQISVKINTFLLIQMTK